MTLTGSPAVLITGTAAGDFSVVSQPTSPVSSNTTTTFQVRFDPTLTGTRVATLTIANNDWDENPYDFAIQGVGEADSDGDGVIDPNDTCPGTTVGLAVNASGCPTVAGIFAASNNPADGGYDLADLTNTGLTNLVSGNFNIQTPY